MGGQKLLHSCRSREPKTDQSHVHHLSFTRVILRFETVDAGQLHKVGHRPPLFHLCHPLHIPTSHVGIVPNLSLGAAAARQLHKWGYRVVLLEGRNRPGGRVYTTRLEVGECATSGEPLCIPPEQYGHMLSCVLCTAFARIIRHPRHRTMASFTHSELLHGAKVGGHWHIPHAEWCRAPACYISNS